LPAALRDAMGNIALPGEPFDSIASAEFLRWFQTNFDGTGLR
jgi:hypothetical protein